VQNEKATIFTNEIKIEKKMKKIEKNPSLQT
jgi:hypothetical protein